MALSISRTAEQLNTQSKPEALGAPAFVVYSHPPGSPRATPASSGTTSAEARSQTEKLIRDAHLVLANCGITLGPSKVTRLVRRFQDRVERNGFEFFHFLANAVQLNAGQRRRALSDPEIQQVICYHDPTGETAVRNVMAVA